MSANMDLRTLVVLACLVILQCVLCRALEKTDKGVCETTTPKKSAAIKFLRRHGKRNTKCPKGYKTCKDDEDLKGATYDPTAQICCAKPIMEPKIEIVCCERWEYNVTSDKCQALCDLGCENGICVEPNTCQCEPPLVLENENKCVQPKCELTCFNSYCVNKTCECDSGFDRINTTHCAKPCDSGLVHDLKTLECVPNCDSSCKGTCTAPNTCTEDHDDDETTNITVVPDCKVPCVNAKCVTNECVCISGYVKNDTNSSRCFKPCDGPCNNGICTQDGICLCSEGFQLNNGSCSPITVKCSTCDGNCTSVDGKPCPHDTSSVKSEVVNPALASLGWVFIGVVVLLVALLLGVIHRTWRRRREYETKTADEGNPYGSVIYTVPNTLIPKDLHNDPLEEDDEFDDEVKKTSNEPLLDNVTNDVVTSERETNHGK